MPTNEKENEALSDEELGQLREMLKSEDRLKWLYKVARAWTLWVSAVIGGVVYGWDAIGKLVELFKH